MMWPIFALCATCIVAIVAILDGENRVLRARVEELERERGGTRCR
jgi:hypothetical protein